MDEDVKDQDSFLPSTTRPPGQKAATQQKHARDDDQFAGTLEAMQESMAEKSTSMNGFMANLVDIMSAGASTSATSKPVANDPYAG